MNASAYQPQKGDIAIFRSYTDTSGGTVDERWSHMAIVKAVDDTYIYVLHGSWSNAVCDGKFRRTGLSAGDGSATSQYAINTVCGYIRPRYASNHTHTIAAYVPLPATCKDLGATKAFYWCSGCGKYYLDEACTQEQTFEQIYTLPIDPSNHVGGTEVRNAAAAADTLPGYTGDTYCKGCGKMISHGETIPCTSTVPAATNDYTVVAELKEPVSISVGQLGNYEYHEAYGSVIPVTYQGNYDDGKDNWYKPFYLVEYTGSGIKKISACYEGVHMMKNGYAVVRNSVFAQTDDWSGLIDKYGIIDSTGKEVVPVEYNSTNEDALKAYYPALNYTVSDGCVKDASGATVLSDADKPYFISDVRGNAVRCEPTVIGEDGLVPITAFSYAAEGFADLAGNIVIPCRYDEVSNFHNGYAVAYTKDGCGLIDTEGNTVIPFGAYSGLSNVSNNGLVWAERYDAVNEEIYLCAILKVSKTTEQPVDPPVGPGSSGGTTVTAPSKEETPAASETKFTDVPDTAWFAPAVAYVAKQGLMSGVTETTFAPNNTLTRAMLAQILYNKENRPTAQAGSFTDVAGNACYSSAVSWCAGKGIVSGYGDGCFGPDDSITREQMAVMLWRYAGQPVSHAALDRFSDAGQISAYARSAMAWAVEQGVISGSDGALLPGTYASRAQTAQILMNYFK